MIQVNEKSIFSFIIFIFAAILLVNSLSLQADAAFIPRIMGIILLVFSFVQLICDLIPAFCDKFRFINKKVEEKSSESENVETTDSIGRRYLFIAWMLLFVLLVFVTNMILAALVSLFIYMKFISKESWKLAIIYSVIFAGSIYLIFVVGMGVYYFI